MILACAAYLFIFYSCKENPIIPPPPLPQPVPKDTITLSLEQVTHASASIKVTNTANNIKSLIRIFRISNSTENVIAEYTIKVKDTVVVDDDNGLGLQLNSMYKYYASRIDSVGTKKDSSNLLEAKTLDTTSFNYTWHEYTIGENGSGLYGIWGTDENNVYAVGEIHLNGNIYGALHYDGVSWTPVDSTGGYSIWGFGPNDIWVAGGGVFHFDGIRWKQFDSYAIGNQVFPLDTVFFNNTNYRGIWGASPYDVYFTSSWGRVVHWNGTKAELLFSRNGETLRDIDGYSKDFIVAVGVDFLPPSLTIYYDGQTWKDFPNVNNDYAINSVSIVNNKHVYFGGDGIFEWKQNGFSKIVSTGYVVWDMAYNRQTGEIVACGVLDGIHIFNGTTWKSFKKQITTDNTTYSDVFLFPNRIFCVGSSNSRAKIIIGKNKTGGKMTSLLWETNHFILESKSLRTISNL